MRTQLSLVELLSVFTRIPGAIRRVRERRAHRRLLRDTPPYSLGELPEGAVGKITGRVRPFDKRLLEAPVSGRLCVYYDVAIDALAGESMLRVLATEQEGMTFRLDDAGHHAVVDPAHAQVSTGIDCVVMTKLTALDARQRALLARHGLIGKRIMFADQLRLRESILEADEVVTVIGCGVSEPDPDAPPAGGYREDRGSRLRLTGTARYPLIISDDPRAR